VSALLEQLLPQGSVRELEGDLLIDADLEGASAKDLNRALLSALGGGEEDGAAGPVDGNGWHDAKLLRLRLEENDQQATVNAG
jgi:hypothetical protein